MPDASFYARPTLQVAHDLIGMVLLHATDEGETAGMIVEVEAYIGESDSACHAAAGPTRRNQPLYGPPGLAYIYFNYGVHWLVNAVTEPAGQPAAVLIRALAPVRGLELMRARRAPRRAGVVVGDWAGRDTDLCRGPGNLTRALAITGAQNQVPLGEGALRIVPAAAGTPRLAVAWSGRIGISSAQDRPWRAYVPGHPSVSGRPR